MTLNSDVFYEQISEDWRQGDIVRNIDLRLPKSDIGILCTPQCDIYHNKADFFLFILAADFHYAFRKIVDPQDTILIEDHVKGVLELTKTKLKELINNLIHNLTGSSANRFYYLPPCNVFSVNLEPCYLDFQRVFTVSMETLREWRAKRTVTVADPFRSQIFARYLSYIGRIGTPDYTAEEIYQILSSSGLRFREQDFKDISEKLFRIIS